MTYIHPTSAGATEDEQQADYGDSDGEDMRRIALPKHPIVIFMRRTRPVLPTCKSLGDKKVRRSPPKRKIREGDTSHRKRKKKRTEIQKSIEKRRDAANKRQRSVEDMGRKRPFPPR